MKKEVAVVLIVLFALLLFACKGEVEIPVGETPANMTITEINIKENSFKSEYLLGETIDFSNARLLVKYSNGKDKEVVINESMTREFDTLREGIYRAYVGYGDRECSFTYTVVTARLNAKRVTKKDSSGKITEIGLEIGIEGVSNIENGIAGMLVKVTSAGNKLNVKTENSVISAKEKFSANYVYTNNTSGTVNFIFEDPSQTARITTDGKLFSVWYDVTDTPQGENNYMFVSASVSNLISEISLKTLKVENIVTEE